jgi:DNA replication protein DnaC
MAAKTNPKTAAMEALIEAHAGELKLPTVKARFRAMAEEATRDQQTPVAYLAALLEAEHQERSERRERRRLVEARFPVMKRLEEFRATKTTPRCRRRRSPPWRGARGSMTASR